LITSANKHGSTHIPNTVVDILAELHGNPDYIVEGGKGKDLPSTIINCRYTPPLIERLGVIPEETITTILNGN
jgi:L-threonylcarbamoyladenylate synthase